MSDHTKDAIIGLLRKSVGLPPAKSSCCSVPVPKEAEPTKSCCETKRAEKSV